VKAQHKPWPKNIENNSIHVLIAWDNEEETVNTFSHKNLIFPINKEYVQLHESYKGA
jgi:hypothetical protein